MTKEQREKLDEEVYAAIVNRCPITLNGIWLLTRDASMRGARNSLQRLRKRGAIRYVPAGWVPNR